MVKTKTRKEPIIIKKERQLKELFSLKKYLEVINEVNHLQNLLDTEFLDYSFFNNKAACIIYAGISNIELGHFDKAYELFTNLEERYEKLKLSRHFWRYVYQNPVDRNQAEMAQEALNLLAEQIQLFNATNSGRYLSNLAYTCYKKRKYKEAIKYYKKALVRNKKDIQLNLGIAQCQYYLYKFFQPPKIKNSFHKTIKMIEQRDTNFDSLLALGKMYYFLKKYDDALTFVQKALEFAEKEPEKKIYAYDWLSRIAYKTKHHDVAISFYEDIIRCLIEYPDNQQDVIHPKPKLYLMMKFLNENKRIVHNKELRAVWYTVLCSLVFTIIFGLLDNFQLFKRAFVIFFNFNS